MYEKLRDQGASKEKAARISNAAANTSRSKVGKKGAKAENYQDRSKEDLLARAKDLGVDAKRSMKKSEIINALRNH
jgi:hypothetical protein